MGMGMGMGMGMDLGMEVTHLSMQGMPNSGSGVTNDSSSNGKGPNSTASAGGKGGRQSERERYFNNLFHQLTSAKNKGRQQVPGESSKQVKTEISALRHSSRDALGLSMDSGLSLSLTSPCASPCLSQISPCRAVYGSMGESSVNVGHVSGAGGSLGMGTHPAGTLDEHGLDSNLLRGLDHLDRLKHLSISTSIATVGRRDRILSDDLLIQDGHCLVSPAAGMDTGLSLDKYGLGSPMGNSMSLGHEPLPLLSPASSVGDFASCGLSPSVLRSLQDASPCGSFRPQVQVQTGQPHSIANSANNEGSPSKTFGGHPTSVGMLMDSEFSMGGALALPTVKGELDLEPMIQDMDQETDVVPKSAATRTSEDAATPPLMASHPATISTSTAVPNADSATAEQFSALPDPSAAVVLLAPPPPLSQAKHQSESNSHCSSSTTVVPVCKLSEPPRPFIVSAPGITCDGSSNPSFSSYSTSVCFSESGQKRGRGGRMTPVEVAFSPTVLPSHKKAYLRDGDHIAKDSGVTKGTGISGEGEDKLTSGDTVGMAGRLRNGRALYSATIAP